MATKILNLAPALVPDYSIIVADATGRRLELFINGDCIREYLMDGVTLEDARKHVEGNKLQNAQAKGLIGADAQLIERDGVATTALILNQAQAKAAYRAMRALSNVSGRVISEIKERGLYAAGNPPVEVVGGDCEEIRIGFRIISGQSPIVVERYSSPAAFAVAYNLQ